MSVYSELVSSGGVLGCTEPHPDYPALRRFTHVHVTRPARARLARMEARSMELLTKWVHVADAPYVSVSGGKDSSVTLHLARRVDATIPGVFARDAEPALPDIDDLLRWWGDQGATIRDFVWASRFALYREHGFNNGLLNGIFDRRFREETAAMGLSAQACGYRADENYGRYIHRAVHGPLRQDRSGRWRCDPLLDWTTDDIWTYHAVHAVPYAQLYDLEDGSPRHMRRLDSIWGTGARQFGRLVRLRRFYPEHYRLFAAAFPELRLES